MSLRILFFTFLFSINVNAQECPGNIGKEFYISFLATGKLHITSTVNTTGTISNPNTSYAATFSVQANGFTVIDIPVIESVNNLNNAITKKGFIVKSVDPISLMTINGADASSDAALIYPIETLGTEYIVTTWGRTFANNFNFPPSAVIVATKDNTLIEVIPSAELTSNQLANVPFTIQLNKGETYVVSGKEDISGSIIRVVNGNNSIAVFCGQRASQIPIGFGAADHLFEQINPVEKLGKVFISPVLKGRGKSILKFVSAFNANTIKLDGNYLTTLNRGEVFTYVTNNTTKYIESSEPIQLGIFGTSYTYDSQLFNLGDPTFMIVQPVQQELKEVNFVAPAFDTILEHHVCVIGHTADINTMVLDGNNISGLFSPVPGNTLFSIASLDVAEGKHFLRSSGGFMAYTYGYGFRQAYGYCAGSAVNKVFNPTEFSCNGISSADTITIHICKGLAGFDVFGQENNNVYSWDFGDGTPQVLTSASVLQQIHEFKQAGNYTVTLTVTNCNQDIEIRKLKLKVHEPYIGFNSSDTLIARGSSMTLFPSTQNGIVTYTWKPNYRITDTTIKNPTVNPLITTPYILTITDTSGCTSSARFLVKVFNGFFMPNAFTPNRDGKNDIFKIPESVYIDLVSFTVYNRWGQMVFNTTDKSKGWNGTVNGREADAGTYVWYIIYNDLYKKKTRENGTVVIVR